MCRTSQQYTPLIQRVEIDGCYLPQCQEVATLTALPVMLCGLQTLHEALSPIHGTLESSGSVLGSARILDVTTLATGLAVADPVIVNWQMEDIGMFPNEYAKSLVARYTDVPAPASTSMSMTNALKPTTAPAPAPTPAPESDGLSTGTQVGIGVG
jgi:hypothetical protein